MIAGTSKPSSDRTNRMSSTDALTGSRSGSVTRRSVCHGFARDADAASSRLGSIVRNAALMRTNDRGAVWRPSIQIIPGSVYAESVGPPAARSVTLIQPISGLRRKSHAIVWMMPGTMSGTSAIPYQRLRSGTSVRSTAQATAVPTAKATTAAPAA